METFTLEGNRLWITVTVVLALAAALGFWARKFFIRKSDPCIDLEKLLTDLFGQAVYSVTFSLREARDWIKARQDKLNAGKKAVVCKINSQTLPMFGLELKKLNLKIDSTQFLVIAIMSQNDSEDIIDSLLVKYKTLDAKLEEALAKGKGTLVVKA